MVHVVNDSLTWKMQMEVVVLVNLVVAALIHTCFSLVEAMFHYSPQVSGDGSAPMYRVSRWVAGVLPSGI